MHLVRSVCHTHLCARVLEVLEASPEANPCSPCVPAALRRVTFASLALMPGQLTTADRLETRFNETVDMDEATPHLDESA